MKNVIIRFIHLVTIDLRRLYKSKFLYSNLEEPKNEDENENKKNENIVDEKQEALV